MLGVELILNNVCCNKYVWFVWYNQKYIFTCIFTTIVQENTVNGIFAAHIAWIIMVSKLLFICKTDELLEMVWKRITWAINFIWYLEHLVYQGCYI